MGHVFLFSAIQDMMQGLQKMWLQGVMRTAWLGGVRSDSSVAVGGVVVGACSVLVLLDAGVVGRGSMQMAQSVGWVGVVGRIPFCRKAGRVGRVGIFFWMGGFWLGVVS